VLSFSLIFS